jgi:site-specific recombinase XerD
LPSFGARALAAIKPADVRAFIAEKITSGAARNTVKNMVATLRAILYQAQEDQHITVNPAARLGRYFDLRRDPSEHVEALTAEEVAKVLAAAAKWYPDHEPAVALLFLHRNARGGAIRTAVGGFRLSSRCGQSSA